MARHTFLALYLTCHRLIFMPNFAASGATCMIRDCEDESIIVGRGRLALLPDPFKAEVIVRL
jgi:hypothetical protein